MKNERLENELKKVWGSDQKMIDYCLKQADEVIEFHDAIVTLVKPFIQTEYCFGYGHYLISDEEEEKIANENVKTATTDKQWFIDKNLSQCDVLEGLDDPYRSMVAVLVKSYENSQIRHLWVMSSFEAQEDRRVVRVLTDDEVKMVKSAVERQKAKFTKRLNSYLKRYGLSKVNAWSYLRD